MTTEEERDAFLDGLVLAREILWVEKNNKMLNLLIHRMESRYGIRLFDLKSPVAGD